MVACGALAATAWGAEGLAGHGVASRVFGSVGTAGVSGVEKAKKKAAYTCVDENVKAGMVVGVGSGSTVVYAVDRLAERYKTGDLKDIVCVPTSFQARQAIIEGGLPLSDLERTPVIDVAIDGADEVDPDLNCIKGGGGCHTLEKLVAANAARFLIIADHRKESPALGTVWTKGIPLEVIPSARVVVSRKVAALGGTPILRGGGAAKAGPAVTDEGNLIIDCHFEPGYSPAQLHSALIDIPGVVETGIFPNMASVAYLGQEDGSLKVLTPANIPPL